MSIGQWEPANAVPVTEELLKDWLELAREAGEQPGEYLAGQQRTAEPGLMKRQQAEWQAAETLENGDIETLIRFFTLAEMQLPGWSAGKTSPVIYLVKILKARDSFDPELKRWIKRNTDNRYLPNGAVTL